MIIFMMNLVQKYDLEDLSMKKRKKSTGELISSVAFFGAAIWLSFEANNLLDTGYQAKAVLVYTGAFLSLLASLRFIIQSLILRVVEIIWPK